MTHRIRLLACVALFLPAAFGAEPGRPAVREAPGILRHLSGALSQLADRVAPAVVQIAVSGYGPVSSENGRPAAAIIALDIDDGLQEKLHLREAKGVVVVARTLDGPGVSSALTPGDAIHAVNRSRIESVEALRRAVKERGRGNAVVLQIERGGRFQYLAFELE